MISSRKSPIRNGFAEVSDLECPRQRELYGRMADFQATFLSREEHFRSAEYRWPSDALNNWSRIWEYPAVFDVIEHEFLGKASPRCADIGSGVTFFPHFLAECGAVVDCLDIDPVCVADVEKASRTWGKEGKVSGHLIEGPELPGDSGGYDIVYCISVLEHVVHPEELVAEILRITAPGGLIVITMDIDLRGDSAIDPIGRRRILSALASGGSPALPTRVCHPKELLTSWNSPVPYGRKDYLFWPKEYVRRALGRPRRLGPSLDLAVELFALRKA